MERLLHGRIQVRPAIERLEGRHVRFSDGTSAEADTIVWCTGHRPGFPFLPAALVPLKDGRMDLYRSVFPVAVTNLAFVGLVEPITGSLMQISEAQARWVAAYLGGRCALPPPERRRKQVERQMRLSERRRASSSRGGLQLEQFDYVWRLEREMRRGRRRARGAGQAITTREWRGELTPVGGG
jgi:dimethylaniline monooxygenase (N-oxide forming)